MRIRGKVGWRVEIWVRAGLVSAVGAVFISACGGGDDNQGLFNQGQDGGGDAAVEGGGACEGDDDCSASAPVCDTRSGQCVQCVLDGHCDDGESCEGAECVASATCENSLDCKDDALPICDPTEGVCVECVSAADCDNAADCTDNRCVEFTPCKNSLDCEGDQVCDPARMRCVGCITSTDCEDGQFCVKDECVTLTPCTSDKDCTAEGKLCDKDLGVCADCIRHADCPSVEHCDQGVCELDVCVQGGSECDGNGITACDADGTAKLPTTPCGASTTCQESGGSATCEPWVCEAGMKHCDGDDLIDCAADGLSIKSSTDCTATGKKCLAGECSDLLCLPSSTYCDGSDVKQCDSTGQNATTIDTCTSNEYCDDATAQCRPQVCSPNQPACDGERATTCNADGSGYAPGGTDCGAMGQSCDGGACVACPSGRGPADELRFIEMFIGTYDYIGIENRSGCPVDVGGLLFSVRSSAAGNDLDYTLPSRTLAPGEQVFISDSQGAQTGDLVPPDNIYFTDATSDSAALCDGPCSSSTVLDYVVHEGGGMASPALPGGVTFSPGPLTGITSANSETESFHRAAYAGSAPAFLASDWTVAATSRTTGTQCPATQPANGASCTELGASCTYGTITCSCLFTWTCS